MKNVLRPLLAAAALLLVSAATASAQGKDAEAGQDQVKEAARDIEREGTVVDTTTGSAIAGAVVTAGDKTVLTDAQGHYRAPAGTQPLQVRAVGYGRATIAASDAGAPTTRLVPRQPMALYLTVYGIGAPFLRDPALEVIDKSGLNALVIDLKGDRGLIPYPSKLPLAAKIGAQKLRTIPDLKELATSLKARGVYLIARIVVFKDDLLAAAHPEWAVRTAGGGLWKDREGLAWLDPSRREAWDFSLSVAEEAAAAGFDEIQFDYVRFPDAVGLAFANAADENGRVLAITDFLREARRRLTPYNVFTAMDSFGYVCWNQNDTGIGQRVEDLATAVDIISPMLYPSGFQFGIPGYRNPVANPYEIVHLSLKECNRRTASTAVRFRPWLQAFTDYAFGGKVFGADEIGKQVKASRDAGTDGWMLWNPRNVYSTNDIKPELTGASTKAAR
jgi:hypothetical protein